MGLIKSKGNMYPWVTHHWSPIKGCKHGCPYCYVQKWDKNWDKPRLDTFTDLLIKLGRGKTIFVGSKCDKHFEEAIALNEERDAYNWKTDMNDFLPKPKVKHKPIYIGGRKENG